MEEKKRVHLQDTRGNSTIFIHILFSALVLNIFYLRGISFSGIATVLPTSSYIIPFFVLVIFSYSLLVGYYSQIRFPKQLLGMIFLFVLFTVLSLGYNIIILGNPIHTTQIWVELIINLLLFVSGFVLASRIRLLTVLDVILIAGVVASFVLIYIAVFELETVRRVGGDLPVGVNHLSHGLGVSLVTALGRYHFNRGKTYLNIIFISLLSIGLFLTGTRSAWLGVGISLSVFVLLHVKTILPTILSAIIGATGSIVIAISIFDFVGDGGFMRLSVESAMFAINYRIEFYTEAIATLFSSVLNVIFGAGFHNYTPIIAQQPAFPDPHNLWLSIAVFFGLPSAIIFFLIHITITIQLLKSIIVTERSLEVKVVILLSLIVASTYAFFSGRLTRIFTIWLLLGFAANLTFHDRLN